MGLSAEQKYTATLALVNKLTGHQRVSLVESIVRGLLPEDFLNENFKWESKLGTLVDEVENKLWREWRNSDSFVEYRRLARERSANATRNNTDPI